MDNKNKIKKILIIFFIYNIKSNEFSERTIEGYFKQLMSKGGTQHLRGLLPFVDNTEVQSPIFSQKILCSNRRPLKEHTSEQVNFDYIHRFFLQHVSLFGTPI
jgi:hypothetical protein